ncbi:MAG TPA: hypothetical protein VMM76_05765 [Pirellulaceae bacterium]|nr:hypothetical protein [Pirellulaceae bacterium]
MKRLTLILAAVGALAFLGTQAMAADRYGYYGARANHNAHHDDLDHRAYHRELYHRDAHRYPMTWRGHEALHDNLNHDAYHDRLEHRSAHRSNAYSPYRSYGYGQYHGFGYYGRGFSIRIGY